MSKQYPGGLITKTPVTPNSISAPGVWSLSDQAKAQATNTWPFPRDPQFNYVTMLLHGDGSAGVPSTGSGAGASSTVTNFNADASTNAFNLAINGDARSNNFTPYQGNGYYSNYFDGTGDYLTTPDNAAFSLGSGNFTIEAWVNPTASPAQPIIIGQWTSSYAWTMQLSNDGDRNLRALLHDGSFNDYVSTSPLQLNVWNHCAFVRESNTVSLYLNGVRVYTTTFSGTVTNSTSAVSIGADASGGQPVQGYISNARVVVGTALYSGTTYTVPTSPLTAVSGTSLLTCQSNRFIDNSTNAFTITANGNAAVAPAVPFTLPSGLTTYGSGYFDGTGDYLTTPMSTPLTLGAGDFTIECWLYSAFSGEQRPLSCLESTLNYYIYAIYLSGTELRFYAGDGTSYAIQMTASGVMKPNAWNHVAVVRSGSTATMYLNGVSVATDASATVTLPAAGTPLWLGGEAYGGGYNFFNGYMTDARIVKGTAVYTTTFTPPTAPLTAITNTSLLTTQYNGGGNNRGFKDSSQNNFVITRNGNTTQGTFAPYAADWSNNFNGTTAYLQFANNAAFDFGSGDFTIEFWMNASTLETGTLQPIINKGTDYGSIYAPFDISRDGTSVQLWLGTAGPTWVVSAASIGTIVIGQWSHFAVTRSGTTFKAFQNGVQTWTTTSSSALLVTTNPFRLAATSNAGSFFNGYLSNVRLVKGTAVYTAAFTPSTIPLTAIANTSLLTCQSNRFIDNSTNAFTVTVTGAPSVQGFSPFAPLTVYNPATYGGSAYFDGTGDSLACTGTLPATGDFTLSLWVYPTNAIGYTQAVEQTGTGNTFTLFLGYSDGKIDIQVGASAYSDYTTGSIKVNQWNYVQVVKASSAFSVYVNGTALSVIASAGNIGTTSIATGTINFKYNTGCYMTDIRIVTSALGNSVPTAPLTAVSGTTTLLNMTNGAIFDNAMINNLESVGNAQISTSVKKFGTGSLAFDGTGDYLFGGNYLSATFGTGDFTIEMWLYYSSSAAGSDFLIDCRPAATNGAYPTIYADTGILYYYANSGNRITSSSISTNTWMHVAVCRSGTSTKMFINGTQTGSTYTDSTNYICRTDGPVIGADRNFGDSLLGYIDDLRITKGYARYTASFTAPTSAFPNG